MGISGWWASREIRPYAETIDGPSIRRLQRLAGELGIILAVGIYSLAKGGTFAKENSNKLMRLRVLSQGVTVVLMLVFLMLIGRGPGN